MFFMTIVDITERLKIEQLYFLHRRLMYKEAYQVLNDHQLSEDAVNESFVRIMKNLHKLDTDDVARTRNFLVIVCRNVAKNIYNQKHKVIKIDENVSNEKAERNSNPENIFITKETFEHVISAIEELPDMYRDIFLLRHSHKLSRNEIAELFGISVETVKKRLTRAKQKVLKTLEKEGII